MLNSSLKTLPLVSIVIINYNTKHLLKSCIESLENQTYKNHEIILIDNLSPDGSCAYAKEHFSNIIAVCNDKNIGYAPAGNQGIKMAKGHYIMLLNPDIIFEEDYLEKCVTKLEEDKKIAAICGKIYKYDFANNQRTKLIDTVGLFCYRNRRVIDNGQGLEDKGQFDQEKEVFGISGACPLYRKEALEDTSINGEYLDEDFFMYKEDVDISWRFRLFGWKCYFLPSAVGNHGRGTGVLPRFTYAEVLQNRSKLTPFQKHYSYKNQRLMMVKNDLWQNVLHDFFPIFLKEFLMLGYMIFREHYLFKSWWLMMRQLPKAFEKRRYIMQHKRVDWREMQKWFGKQSEYLR